MYRHNLGSRKMAKQLIENMDDVQKELSVLFDNLKNRKIKPHEAKESANIAGKFISSAKYQLEYAVLKKKIPGLEIKAFENAR